MYADKGSAVTVSRNMLSHSDAKDMLSHSGAKDMLSHSDTKDMLSHSDAFSGHTKSQ